MTEQTKTTEAPPAQEEQRQDAPIVKTDLEALKKVKVAGELDLLTAAKAFAASGMFPDTRTQSQAIVKIVAGYELGVPPFASMQGFHCIPRKRKVGDRWVEEVELSMSANLRAAIIRRDPNIDMRIVEHTDAACEVEVAVRFAGQWEKRGTVRYTIEEAQKVQVPAGGGQTRPLADGQMWKNYPADMLFAAVMRRIAKRYAPHLFLGERTDAPENDLIAAEADVVDGDVIEGSHEAEHGTGGADSGETGPEAGGNGLDAAPAADNESTGTAGEPESAPADPLPGSSVEPTDGARAGAHDVGEAGADPTPVPAPDVIEMHGFTVHFVGGEPTQKESERCTAQQWATVNRIGLRAELGPEQVQDLFETRHGFKGFDARKATADEFGNWLREEIKRLAKAAKR